MIYDCFSFFNEIDILKIRMNMLDPHVDFFLIAESRLTFSGKKKPLYFDKNRKKFKKWEKKIVYIESPPRPDITDPFEQAEYQKQYLTVGLRFNAIKNDDIVYYGDTDEIWKPQEIKDEKVYSLEQINYCYYLNNRSSEKWVGTVVGKWKTIKEKPLAHYRATHTNVIPNAGWHFTNMGGADQIRKKLEAYDHQEYNNDNIKKDVEFNMKHGFDYVGRNFEMWIDDSQLPEYIINNKDTYKHLWK